MISPSNVPYSAISRKNGLTLYLLRRHSSVTWHDPVKILRILLISSTVFKAIWSPLENEYSIQTSKIQQQYASNSGPRRTWKTELVQYMQYITLYYLTAWCANFLTSRNRRHVWNEDVTSKPFCSDAPSQVNIEDVACASWQTPRTAVDSVKTSNWLEWCPEK